MLAPAFASDENAVPEFTHRLGQRSMDPIDPDARLGPAIAEDRFNLAAFIQFHVAKLDHVPTFVLGRQRGL